MTPRRLEVGELVRVGESVYRVARVNASRARLDLVGGVMQRRDFTTRRTGKHVAFDAPKGRRYLSVSPFSILERVE